MGLTSAAIVYKLNWPLVSVAAAAAAAAVSDD